MPTGYTAAIKDGITFEKFVWSCARAMGAMIMMRDEPSDAPIPERFEPSSFYAEKVDGLRAELSRLKALTREQAHAESVAAFQRALKAHDEAIAEKTELRNKYSAMLAKVVQWEPPTPEHNGFEAFMLEQLHSSINFDCDTSYYEKHPPECKSADGWRSLAIAEAERQLACYENAQREEVERTESRNAWLKALRESVPPATTGESSQAEPGEIVEVLCFNFPDGSTYWAARAGLDAEAVVQRWKDHLTPEQRAAYVESGAHGGFCIVRMPRADYQRIPATSQSATLFA
jgi:hypothetical protein